MLPRALFAVSILTQALPAAGEQPCSLTVQQQKEDAALLIDALEFAHVGLERYEPRSSFRVRAAALTASLRRPSDCLDVFSIVTIKIMKTALTGMCAPPGI